jgi:site-specific DNA-methyltransferase (adenine-specific)
MAMADYAWCSFDGNAKVIDLTAINQQGRFHPTQKPIDLYKWIFRNYAKDGYKILDTHLGSGSSRIAAWDAGLDFWGYEIDEDYFGKMQNRFEAHTSQLRMDF